MNSAKNHTSNHVSAITHARYSFSSQSVRGIARCLSHPLFHLHRMLLRSCSFTMYVSLLSVHLVFFSFSSSFTVFVPVGVFRSRLRTSLLEHLLMGQASHDKVDCTSMRSCVPDKHMAEMKFSWRDAAQPGSQRSGAMQSSAAQLGAVGSVQQKLVEQGHCRRGDASFDVFVVLRRRKIQ